MCRKCVGHFLNVRTYYHALEHSETDGMNCKSILTSQDTELQNVNFCAATKAILLQEKHANQLSEHNLIIFGQFAFRIFH